MRLFSWLYLKLHTILYNYRKKRAVHFPGKHIISIGNLSMGGTGKTPITLWLADRLEKFRPLAVLRGYGRQSRGPVLVSKGQGPLVSWRESGDEAQLLAECRGLTVAVCKRRAEAIQSFGKEAQVVLLDDAFQNPSVAAGVTLVLIDVTIAPDQIRIFPQGKFREGLSALSRATVILLTRINLVPEDALTGWQSAIAMHAPKVPVFLGSQKFCLQLPAARQVGAFCAIGNPEAYFAAIRREGITLQFQKAFPDHHAFRKKDMDLLFALCSDWIVTEKDFVKLQFLAPEEQARLHIARQEIFIKDEKRFFNLLAPADKK